MKIKIPLMLIVIIILQIALPMLTVIWESGLTLISNAEDNTEYYINTAQDLWDFAVEVNNGNTFEGITVKLTADIDLGCSEDNQWIPIADYSSNSANIFKGTFKGNNYTISGIYINSDKQYQGLFGYNAGIISNLTIEGQVSSSGSCTGTVVGYNTGNITAVINKVTFAGGENSGGICGRNYGEINLCQNNASITGLESITGKELGGIVGFNSGTVMNSNNTGIINGNESQGLLSGVGGIVGYNEGIVENCNNTETINNHTNTGGIVGLNCGGSIINCSNSANIIGESMLGGIAGQNDYRGSSLGYAIVLNCLNTGDVKSVVTYGTTYVGGIAGDNSCSSKAGRAVIIKCQNSGLIEGSSYVGGLCGSNGDANGGKTSYIKKSVNTGNVKSYTYNTTSSESTMAYVGGIVGETGSGYVEECQNYGNVEGLNLIGGIAGLSSSTILRCSNFGEIKAVVSSENNSTRLTSIQSAGIVSYNYGEIYSCYNTGKIIASVLDNLYFEAYASGLVSNNVNQSANDGVIKDSYTVGQLQATTNTSIIELNGGTATNCYYLDTSCNAQYEETQNQVIKSCTSDNMKTAEFINTLNSNTFEIDSNNQNNGYPVLKEIQGVSITFEDEILYEKILEKVLHKIENYNDETMTIEITQSNIDTITTLELDNSSINSSEKIENINGIQYFRNLTTLDLAFNNISDISKLQYLTNLEYLSLEANNISNIDAISGLEKLQTLYLNYNDITTIPSLNLPSLTYLDLRTNKLTDISNLSSLENLEELYLYNYTYSGVETDRENAIVDASPLEELDKLTNLDARNQRIKRTVKVGEEISLPLIFIQAKDEQSVAYSEENLSIGGLIFNNDGTRITVAENVEIGTKSNMIRIMGGAFSGSTLEVTVISNEITDNQLIKGDVNGDKIINFADILAINKHRLNKEQLTGIYLEAADVTGDRQVNFADILLINKYRLKKINSL